MKSLALVVCLFAALNARGQNSAPAIGSDTIKIGGVTVIGSLRSRVYGWG
jgi:hypothetical protein